MSTNIFACPREFICYIQNRNPVTQANLQLGQLKIYLRSFEEWVSSIPQSQKVIPMSNYA